MFDLDGLSNESSVTKFNSVGINTTLQAESKGMGSSTTINGISAPQRDSGNYMMFDFPTSTVTTHLILVFKHVLLSYLQWNHLNFLVHPAGAAGNQIGIATGYYGGQYGSLSTWYHRYGTMVLEPGNGQIDQTLGTNPTTLLTHDTMVLIPIQFTFMMQRKLVPTTQ